MVEATPGAAAAGETKGKRDSRSYAAKPLEELEALDASEHPFPAPKLELIRSEEGRGSIRAFKSKSPSETVDDLLGYVAHRAIKARSLRRGDAKELTKSKLDAWLGIRLLLHAWRRPAREKRWAISSSLDWMAFISAS